jgi:hypothetical protein
MIIYQNKFFTGCRITDYDLIGVEIDSCFEFNIVIYFEFMYIVG